MKGVVVIPTWQRADFLSCCLRHITEAKGWEEYLYIFMLDRRHSQDVEKVAKAFTGEKEIHKSVHSSMGNSYNVLSGFKIAREKGFDVVHLIEEDIFIAPGYFEFHEKAWAADPSAFFVSACFNQNLKYESPDTEAIYRHQSYQSLGVSLSRPSLDKILIHANAKYFKNMKSYCENDLRTRLGSTCVEQDGMIHRVILLENAYGIYPDVPRAFHAGFKGYNRPGRVLPEAYSVQQRADMLYAMPEHEMNLRAANPAHKDIHRCRMDYFEPESLKLRI